MSNVGTKLTDSPIRVPKASRVGRFVGLGAVVFGVLSVARLGQCDPTDAEIRALSTIDRSWTSLLKLFGREVPDGIGSIAALRVWAMVSSSVIWLRVASVIGVVGAAIAVYLAIRTLLNGSSIAKRAAIVGGMFVVVHGSVAAEFGRVSFEAFGILLSALMFLTFVRVLTRPSFGRLVLWSCCCAGAVLSQQLLLVAVASQVLFVVGAVAVGRLRIRKWFGIWFAVSAVPSAALVLGLRVVARLRGLRLGPMFQAEPSSRTRALGVVLRSLAGVPAHGSGVSTFLALVVAAAGVSIVAAAVRVAFTRARRRLNDHMAIELSESRAPLAVAGLACCGAIGGVAALGVAVAPTTLLPNRSMTSLIPAIALLVGPALGLIHAWQGVEQLSRTGSKFEAKLSWAVAMVFTVLVATLGSFSGLRRSPSPWSSPARTMFAEANPGDVVVFSNDEDRLAFELARPTTQQSPMPLQPVEPWGGFDIRSVRRVGFTNASVERAIDTAPRIWVVVRNGPQSDLSLAVFGKRSPAREQRGARGRLLLYNLAAGGGP